MTTVTKSNLSFGQKVWAILKETYKRFNSDDPMSYSATIAFYTIFSLPALLIIIVRVASTFFGEEAVQGEIVSQISNLVGKESAKDIQDILKNASLSTNTVWATVVSIGTLIFSSTTVFISIQKALNSIWRVRPKPERGWLKLVKDRLSSFVIVVVLGFLLLVSLVMDAALQFFMDYIQKMFSGLSVVIAFLFENLIALAISTFIFGLIFKVLPDAELKWKDVFAGALITAILFAIGKYLIGLYLGTSDLGDTYGAAGSILILLVWVYYSSLLILIGAEITLAYTHIEGRVVEPSEHAVKIVIRETTSEALNPSIDEELAREKA